MTKQLTESDVRYFVDSIKKDHELTGWFTFAKDNNYTWAIVFGWVDDGYDNGMLIKTAYCHNNSAMNEYEYGWYMPYDKEYNEDYDTESYFEDGPDLAERIIATIPSWNAEIQYFMKHYVGQYQE